MLQKEQFDDIREVLNKFVESPEVQEIYSHANFTEMQLKALIVLMVQAVTYYDALHNGAELTIR